MNVRALVAAGVLVALLPSVALAAPAEPRQKPRPKKVAAPRSEKKAPPPRPPAPPPAQRPAPAKTTPVIHEVERGETLGAIARQYNVTVASLVIANRLRGPRARLQPGQRLSIPRAGTAPAVRGRRAPVDEPLPVSLVLSVPEFEDSAPRFIWPVIGPVTSTFGRRSQSWHRGVDIRADPGTPIVASAPGVVIASGYETRYGLRVKIEHEGGFITVYAHNERNAVDVGASVAAGQVIGTVGRTGRATAEHVHFEIRLEGRVYNPLYLLPLPPRPIQIDLTAPHDQDDEE